MAHTCGRLMAKWMSGDATSAAHSTICSPRVSLEEETWKLLEFGLGIDLVRYSILLTELNGSDSFSSLEWQIIDIAIYSYQKVAVSLYDTLGKDSVGEHLCSYALPYYCVTDALPEYM